MRNGCPRISRRPRFEGTTETHILDASSWQIVEICFAMCAYGLDCRDAATVRRLDMLKMAGYVSKHIK